MTITDEEFVPVKRRRAEAARAAAAAATRRGATGLANAAIHAVSSRDEHRAEVRADHGGDTVFASSSHFNGPARSGRGSAPPEATGFGGRNGETKSLLEEAAELESRFESRGTENADSAVPDHKMSAVEVAQQEAQLLVEMNNRAALRPVAELAAGKTYTEPHGSPHGICWTRQKTITRPCGRKCTFSLRGRRFHLRACLSRR
jgi:hypothetical protein